MERLIRILLGVVVITIVVVRIAYCCIFHADEVFGKKPLKETA